MVTPNGDLIVIETVVVKLESRRKVVAQILDYAKEMSNGHTLIYTKQQKSNQRRSSIQNYIKCQP